MPDVAVDGPAGGFHLAGSYAHALEKAAVRAAGLDPREHLTMSGEAWRRECSAAMRRVERFMDDHDGEDVVVEAWRLRGPQFRSAAVPEWLASATSVRVRCDDTIELAS
ncbi:MAG TPA: hypothetical protein VFI55_06915 [Mycobacterium sp.]|nr:hypothetical protein [Mycobacterium sp.]